MLAKPALVGQVGISDEYWRAVMRMNVKALEDPATSPWKRFQLWHRCWTPGCLRWKWKTHDVLCSKHRAEWLLLNPELAKNYGRHTK